MCLNSISNILTGSIEMGYYFMSHNYTDLKSLDAAHIYLFKLCVTVNVTLYDTLKETRVNKTSYCPTLL